MSTKPLSINAPPFMPTMGQAAPVAPASLTVQDFAQLLAASRKDHLPEWKLFQYNCDPLQWHDASIQFKSAIHYATPTDGIKLTYLKTLVTGKAKTAIAEFAYWGTMYQDASRTLERNFRQPHAVVSAHLDKLSHISALEMQNSKNIISYSATISALVGAFRSLHYLQNLTSATLLGQAIQKLPPNLNKAWAMHTVKNKWRRPTLLDFKDWLKKKTKLKRWCKWLHGNRN